MKRWYVVQTKANQETLAVQQLTKQRFTVFHATYLHHSTNKRSGSPMQAARSLFPSYIFVQFDHIRNKRWPRINSTRGCLGLIGYTDEYLTPLPQGCVEELMQRVADGYVPLKQAVQQIMQFTPDMEVVISRGALKGQLARYCKHSKNRVTLLLRLLNQPMRVILPIDAVSLAPHSVELAVASLNP